MRIFAVAPQTVSSSQLVEVDGPRPSRVDAHPLRDVPQLLPEHGVVEQLGDRHVEHADDLGRVGREHRPRRQHADEGREHEAPHDGREAVELADHLDARGVEADLLVGLAERSGLQVGVVVLLLAARERDLALVRRHGVGPLREDHVRLALVAVALVEERHEHRGEPRRLGRRRSVRGREGGGRGAYVVGGEAPLVVRQRGPRRRRPRPGGRGARDDLTSPTVGHHRSVFFARTQRRGDT